MKISIKCPKCYKQVPKDNRFCDFCGCNIADAGASSSSDETIAITDTATGDLKRYKGPRFCPKGHDVPDPSLGFCTTCGSPLKH